MEDLVRRSGIGRPALESLATSGALAGLGSPAQGPQRARRPPPGGWAGALSSPREALWAAGAAAVPARTVSPARRRDRCPTTAGNGRGRGDVGRPADARAVTRLVAYRFHPDQARRPGSGPQRRSRRGGRRSQGPCRRRGDPSPTAGHGGGTTFLNLEDETGLVNVICSPGCWTRYRKAARSAVVLLVRGRLERGEGADPLAPPSSNVVAEYLEEIDFAMAVGPSRDFH